MKKSLCCLHWLALTAVAALVACQKPEEISPVKTEHPIAEQTCFTTIPDDHHHHIAASLPPNGAVDRAAGLKNYFWAPGTTLRVRFPNGSTALQARVMRAAKTWEQYASIRFQQTPGNAEIRIQFSNDGHWSYVGIYNLQIPQNQKTMNLAFTDNTSEQEVQRTTLHEFGHALGLGHEHQNPLADIQWDKPKAYNF